MEIRRKDFLFMVAGLIPALFVAASAFLIVPEYMGIYAPVAAKLPIQTRFVFSFYYLCALLPVAVPCIWYFWRNPIRRGLVAAGFGVVGSIVVFAFGWWAVYQPDLILQVIKLNSR